MKKGIMHSLLGQHLMLAAGRALFWHEEQVLIIADPHFGKAQVFRERGIPIPGGTTADDLKRLSCLIDQFVPNKLLILGDLIHDRFGYDAEFNRLIDQWRRQHSGVQFLLVSGNHDLRAGDIPAGFQLDMMTREILIHPFLFTHKPKTDNSVYGFAGHLHPAVTIAGKGPLKETLPCFCFGPRAALLPAFGTFTGTQVINPTIEDQVYVIADDEVIRL